MLAGERIVSLSGTGKVTIALWGCNVFTLTPTDRKFLEEMLSLIEVFQQADT